MDHEPPIDGERGHAQLKVLDFGIARDVSDSATALTRTGAIAGSASTVSPEVVSGETAGPPADVYGLGAVLYLTLTGRYPFESERRQGLLRAHLSDEVVPPSARTEHAIPSDLEAIALRCLAKDPGARYAHARELALALAGSSVAGQHRPSLGVRPTRPQQSSRGPERRHLRVGREERDACLGVDGRTDPCDERGQS